MPSSEIQVFTGGVFDPLNPDPAKITVQDIAHSLSLQCRFSGHIARYYSVAEHCVRVSQLVPQEDAAKAVLHDGTEGYLTDIASPLKHGLFGSSYREAEERLWEAICVRFNLTPELPQSVKDADLLMLVTERAHLLPNDGSEAVSDLWAPWTKDVEPLAEAPECWPWQTAEAILLGRFDQLGVR